MPSIPSCTAAAASTFSLNLTFKLNKIVETYLIINLTLTKILDLRPNTIQCAESTVDDVGCDPH